MHDLTEEQIRSFWDRVAITSPNECWNWTRGRNGPGAQAYGIVWFGNKKYKCHRLSLALSIGEPTPSKNFACHRCDNPTCCNPAHLYWGTPKDNSRDCKERGRLKKEMGSSRYNAKLTEEAVAEIKAQAPFRTYGWGRAMARKYGVAATAINNIVHGRRWKQVGGAARIVPLQSPHRHKNWVVSSP